MYKIKNDLPKIIKKVLLIENTGNNIIFFSK